MKAVLDTNVLISGVISEGVCHEVLVEAMEERYVLVTSQGILEEFRETLAEYPEKFGMTLDEIQEEVDYLRYYGDFYHPEKEIERVEEDPDDDKFLEVALAADADFIVTGDPHLKQFDSFQGIDIVNPVQFSRELE